MAALHCLFQGTNALLTNHKDGIMAQRNPFIYGRPVRGEEAIRRENQIQTVLNRLRNAESTAVIGEPHSGKTSFLFHLMQPDTVRAFLEEGDQRLLFSNLDLLSIEEDYAPENFWSDALAPLSREQDAGLQRLVRKAVQAQFSRQALEKLFAELAARNTILVLLLDEFERLLKHPNFKIPAFFACLRGLSTRTGGLALVAASRMGVAELNQRGRELLDTGSPLFNAMVDVPLPPFDDAEIDLLLSRAVPPFSEREKTFIRRVAGRNPFLLQAMAANACEAALANRPLTAAAEGFYRGTTLQHFDDLWASLDDAARTVAVILSLQEIGGRALGSVFNYGEIERVDRYGLELQKLAERGLAERLESSRRGWMWDGKNLLLWRGERWAMTCAAFSWWVRDVAIASTRSIPAYDEWLRQKKYIGLLTQKQWDDAQNLLRRIPASMLRGTGSLAKSLWNEILNTTR